MRIKRASVSLFWRIFFLLAGLLAACTAAWVQIAITIESEPRALQTAQQVSSLINLSRTALIHADPSYRMALIKSMAKQEGVRIWPKEVEDVVAPKAHDTVDERLRMALQHRLGQQVLVTSSVNGVPGLWVSFMIEDDEYWMLADPSRLTPITSGTWLLWLVIAFFLALAGSVVIASRLSAPLKRLAKATVAVRRGDFSGYRLDETVHTTEIREVNRGFNEMAAQLAKLEQDRVVMMAGLSHDLRTPLTRLRLEAEMSVPDSQARAGMSADIDQMDQLINKFLDYARPRSDALCVMDLADLVTTQVERAIGIGTGAMQLVVRNTLTAPLWVLADPTDTSRVIGNLLENAKHYGATPNSSPPVTQVDIVAVPTALAQYITIRLRDHGAGVPDADLAHLTTPFYRADTARSQAAGSGLGLAIVDKTMLQMGGRLHLSNAIDGGLQVDLSFQTPRANAK